MNSEFSDQHQLPTGRYADTIKVQEPFQIKNTVIHVNKLNIVNHEKFSKEGIQRRKELKQTIKNNREQIMVCALGSDGKDYYGLKYCFVQREGKV